MESAVGRLWVQTAGAAIRLRAPLSYWRKQLYYRQIPVISFALHLVEAEKRADAFSGSLFQLQKDTSEHGACI
jgi:hypothetical protein